MTGKGDDDKARKQCVTNHMNEYRLLTIGGKCFIITANIYSAQLNKHRAYAC